MKAQLKLAIFLLMPAVSLAQVPVDDDGRVIGQYEVEPDAVLLSPAELEELVGPIALYPDDLLAIVLPASAYPLQIVEAARFLEAYENDSSLEPDENWDDSVVALINYPEVIDLLNNDLDWTLRLGDAVVAQQADVVAAVETFRDRAYAAGNLKSDEYQTVSKGDDGIFIEPAEEDVIYVPYYEPARVVYYQPEPVYYYYPRPRPVYYYPYGAGHHFAHGYFWGVTTAFTIGWSSHSLHTWHHSYHGHPYYGHSYWNHWYRRPSIHVYNTYYTHNYRNRGNYHSQGDRWNAHDRRREYVRREGYLRTDRRGDRPVVHRNRESQPIAFRERDSRVTPRPPTSTTRQNTTPRNGSRQDAADRRESQRRDSNNRTRQAERQEPTEVRSDTTRSSGTRRQDAADRRESQSRGNTARPRDNERPEITFRQRETERSRPAVQSRNTERRTPAVRQRETHAQVIPRQSSRPSQPQRQSEPRAERRQQPAQPQRQSEPRAAQRQQPAQQQSSSRSSNRQSEGRDNRSQRRSRR